MIVNIRWPHCHSRKVMPHTITIHGANFVCTKCLDIDYYLWQTSLELYRAKIYLTVKESDEIIRRLNGQM